MTKQEYFRTDSRTMFLDHPAAVAAYCKREWPGECAHIIRVADEVCRNMFLFDLKWDMERTWTPLEFPDGKVDWEAMPGGDPEFIFQFNRHRYFICLGQAYHLTGDERYARHYVRLLMDWIHTQKRNPETEKTTWRVLEAGFRGEFWVKAMWYFKDSPSVTDEVVDAYYQCLIEHAEFIMSMHSPYRYISNWGVIENHGLFEIGVAMQEEKRRVLYTQTALSHMRDQARIQIMDDGVHWEQSTAYHNEVLHCYEDVLMLADKNGIPVPEDMREAVRRMAYADLAWKKPDHCQFMMGDSDHTDIRDYISVAACLYMDPVLKYGGLPKLDYDSVWDLGAERAEAYRNLKAEEPGFSSIALADSGNYYLRDGWGEDGNLLHFHCGTMGAGHGHSDKLHLDLVIQGEDVLTDAGRFTYVSGNDRFEFKNPTAHNTITVDGRFFTVCRDSWECSKLCQPVKQGYKLGARYELIQGGHLGYADAGVFVNRKILHIKPDIYVVMDEMYTDGAHEYEQFWHFNEEGHVTLEKGLNMADVMVHGPFRNAFYRGRKAAACFSFMSRETRVVKGVSRIARDYNRAVNRECIRVTGSSQGFTSFLTVIQGGEAESFAPCKVTELPVKSALKGTFYPSSMAEAVHVEGGGRDYVVIICHQEVNSPTDMTEAGGCMGFGNVIVFDRTKSRLGGTVMNY